MNLINKKLQVHHYPNVPCKPFCVDVKDEYEAKKVIDTLANQHLWLYENGFIPDYANVITVVMQDEDKIGPIHWTDYYNEEEMMEWDEFEETYL